MVSWGLLALALSVPAAVLLLLGGVYAVVYRLTRPAPSPRPSSLHERE